MDTRNFYLMPSRRISKENHFLYLNFQKKKMFSKTTKKYVYLKLVKQALYQRKPIFFRYSWAQPTFIATAQFTDHHLKCSLVTSLLEYGFWIISQALVSDSLCQPFWLPRKYRKPKKERSIQSIWLLSFYSCWLCLKNDAYI